MAICAVCVLKGVVCGHDEYVLCVCVCVSVEVFVVSRGQEKKKMRKKKWPFEFFSCGVKST